MRRFDRTRPARGFTLIELLVVIAVISVLAAISIPVLGGVRKRQNATATKLLIENLKVKLEQYASDFGDFPPSTPKLVGLPSNGVNDGIECLVRCLSTKRKSGPYFEFPEGQLGNSDDDTATGNPTGSYMTARELFELQDAFGNALIYLHNADYEKGHKVKVGDEVFPVKGCKSKKRGQFHGLTSYQIWSVGANGKDDQGEEDDVTSWSSS